MQHSTKIFTTAYKMLKILIAVKKLTNFKFKKFFDMPTFYIIAK